MIMVPTGMSVAALISILIDRFLMIAHPLKYRCYMDNKTLMLWLMLVWLLASIYPTKFAIVGKTKTDEITQKILALNLTIFSTAMYSLTYFKLKTRSKDIMTCNANIRKTHAEQNRHLKERRFLRTIILIASFTLLCLSPRVILDTVDVTENIIWQNLERKITTMLGCLFQALYSLNFAVNPLVYFLRLPNYRKTFKLLLWRNSS